MPNLNPAPRVEHRPKEVFNNIRLVDVYGRVLLGQSTGKCDVRGMNTMTTEQLSETIEMTKRFGGKWYNQHHSEMEIVVGIEGQISGVFRTGFKDNCDSAEEFPLVGFASRDVIAFCVNFVEHSSVTAWVGQLSNITEDDNVERLHTLWHMTVDVGDRAESLWKSVISGADCFVRGSRPSQKTSLKTAASHPLWLQRDSMSSAY